MEHIKVECFIDIGQDSKLDVNSIFDMLATIIVEVECQIWLFHHKLKGPYTLNDKNKCSKKKKKYSDMLCCMLQIYDMIQVKEAAVALLFLQHSTENLHKRRYSYDEDKIKWITISQAEHKNDKFAESIRATNIYLNQDVEAFLKEELCSSHGFEMMMDATKEDVLQRTQINSLDLESGICTFCKEKKTNLMQHLIQTHCMIQFLSYACRFSNDDDKIHESRLRLLLNNKKFKSRLECLQQIPFIGFKGEIEVCNKSLHNPFLIKVLNVDMDIPIYQFSHEKKTHHLQKTEATDNIRLLPKEFSLQRNVIVSYNEPHHFAMQLMASYCLRLRWTQNQHDLFALQCAFFVHDCCCGKKQEKEEKKLIAIARNCILPIMRHSDLKDIIDKLKKNQFHRCIQSNMHLFAVLFALRYSDREGEVKLLSSIAFESFAKFILADSFNSQYPFLTYEDVIIDNFYSFMFDSVIERDLNSSRLFLDRLNSLPKKWFLKLMDETKCRNLFLHEERTNNSLFEVQKNLSAIHSEYEILKLFDVVNYKQLVLFLFDDNKIKDFVISKYLYKLPRMRQNCMNERIQSLKLKAATLKLIGHEMNPTMVLNFHLLQTLLRNLHHKPYFMLGQHNACLHCFQIFHSKADFETHLVESNPLRFDFMASFITKTDVIFQQSNCDFTSFEMKCTQMLRSNGQKMSFYSSVYLQERYWQLVLIHCNGAIIIPKEFEYLKVGNSKNESILFECMKQKQQFILNANLKEWEQCEYCEGSKKPLGKLANHILKKHY